MQDKNMRIVAWIVGIVVAICVIGGGIGRLKQSKEFENKSVEVEATVTRVQKSGDDYTAYITYECNGMKYQDMPLHNQSFCEEGDKKKILVDLEYPSVFTTGNSLSPASYAMMFGGVLLGIIMAVKLIDELRGKRG